MEIFYNETSTLKILRKSLGHDCTSLNKLSWKFSVVKQKQYVYNKKIFDFCNFSIDSFGVI